jgi:VIT1/CCC1 family predicted Fe2+/Mn2+ transporter
MYIHRGLEPLLAGQVAEQLMAHDALSAHARDELGISEHSIARPVQAALTSAGSFAIGAVIPVLTSVLVPRNVLVPGIIVTTVLLLALLGGIGAHLGGAPILKGVLRVTFWGALAMAITAGVGALFGAVV